jgi:hypothetical protein
MVFNSQLTDRFTIMTPEMMGALVRDLNAGNAAFNKLHESRSALPVGHSVYGKIKELQDGGKEIHAMMYAAVKRPDGTEFTEGKDLVDRYKMGAVRSCSAGVIVGFYRCNICGNDIRDYNKCEHIPGRQYDIDEQPKTCIAFMTGHKINDGVAEDCGIYEVSAVTAGGVAAAGAMTEAFGRYEDGSDVKEFKKTVIDDKGIDMRLEFSAAPNPEEFDSSDSSEEEIGMEKKDVKEMLDEHYAPLKAENEKLTGDLGKLQGEFDVQKTELGTATARVTELEGQIETKTAEFTAAGVELETAKGEATAATGFKAEYTALVLAKGIKSGAEVTEEEFATKTLEELKTLNTSYDTVIAAMVDGQQSGEDDDDATEATLDDSFYKS